MDPSAVTPSLWGRGSSSSTCSIALRADASSCGC